MMLMVVDPNFAVNDMLLAFLSESSAEAKSIVISKRSKELSFSRIHSSKESVFDLSSF